MPPADDPYATVPPDDAAQSQAGFTVLPVGGGYLLLKLLGRGAFGEVWQAEAPGGVEVAVKVITTYLERQIV